MAGSERAMISDSQLPKVAAGGCDNWVEKSLGRKIVHPLEQVGLSHITHFNTERLPSMPIHGSGFKDHRKGLWGMFQDGENVGLCVWGGSDGVKPKALSPQPYNAWMTGGHDWEFQGSGPGIRDSLCQSFFERKEFGV